MKRLALLCLLPLAASSLLAQAPAVMSVQGRLLSAGTPVTGPQNLTFRLYLVQAGGSPIWTETQTGVAVADGIYDVQLGETTSLVGLDFSRPLYLGVQVGSASELSPRTLLGSVPAAMTLSVPALVKAPIDGAVLTVENTDAREDHRAIVGRAAGRHGVAVLGEAIGLDETIGVRGTSESTVGRGVQGIVTALTGVNFGVAGTSNSDSGIGVHGTGKYAGVSGLAEDTGQTNFGVEGISYSAEGAGVRGIGWSTSGSNAGVVGVSNSPQGEGVMGINYATTLTAIGVRAESFSTQGVALVAEARASSGRNFGILASTNSGSGYSGWFVGGLGLHADKILASRNSDGFNPQVSLEEAEEADYARLRLKNISNVQYWDIAGGSTNNTVLNFFTSQQRGNVLSLRATGSPVVAYNGAYLSEGGVWVDNSSLNAKTDFAPVDATSVLDRLAGLTVREWSYRNEDGVRHMGPMAEDFFQTFGLGNDNRSLASLDVNGVALVAIQALLERVEALEEELRVLKGKR